MNTSLDRKLEAVAKRIEEERKAAKPLTEEQFEKGQHMKSGQVIPTNPSPWIPPWIKVERKALTAHYIACIEREAARIDGVTR